MAADRSESSYSAKERDTIIAMIHDIYFGPTIDKDKQPLAARSSAYIYLSFSMTFTSEALVPAFMDAVARYGADHIVDRLKMVFSWNIDSDPAIWNAHAMITQVACTKLTDKGSWTLLKKGIPGALVEEFWQMLKAHSEAIIPISVESLALYAVQSIIRQVVSFVIIIESHKLLIFGQRLLEKSLLGRKNNQEFYDEGIDAVRDLCEHHDLIRLLGKSMCPTLEAGVFGKHVTSHVHLSRERNTFLAPIVRLLSTIHGEGFAAHIHRDWIAVLYGLRERSRTVTASRITKALVVWEDFGIQSGAADTSFRKREMDKICDISERKGCSWVKCPLYNAFDDARIFLKCAACASVSTSSFSRTPDLTYTGLFTPRQAHYCNHTCQTL